MKTFNNKSIKKIIFIYLNILINIMNDIKIEDRHFYNNVEIIMYDNVYCHIDIFKGSVVDKLHESFSFLHFFEGQERIIKKINNGNPFVPFQALFDFLLDKGWNIKKNEGFRYIMDYINNKDDYGNPIEIVIYDPTKCKSNQYIHELLKYINIIMRYDSSDDMINLINDIWKYWKKN